MLWLNCVLHKLKDLWHVLIWSKTSLSLPLPLLLWKKIEIQMVKKWNLMMTNKTETKHSKRKARHKKHTINKSSDAEKDTSTDLFKWKTSTLRHIASHFDSIQFNSKLLCCLSPSSKIGMYSRKVLNLFTCHEARMPFNRINTIHVWMTNT